MYVKVNVLLQVGPGDGYKLTVLGYNAGLSTMFGPMIYSLSYNGTKFSTW